MIRLFYPCNQTTEGNLDLFIYYVANCVLPIPPGPTIVMMLYEEKNLSIMFKSFYRPTKDYKGLGI